MSSQLLATIELGEYAIGGSNQILVVGQVVRRQGHPAREFGHDLRPILIRERFEVVEQLLRSGCHDQSVPC
jgi:hypothetical protein